MTKLFIVVLNMSITASYAALAVIVIRLLFKKAPKVFSYVLWLAVLIRLVCPVSFSSAFSFLGLFKPGFQSSTRTMEYVPYSIGIMQNPAIRFGISLPLPPATPMASANPMQIIADIAGAFWGVGVAVLLIYCVVSYLKVMNNVKTATLIRDRVFETDRIATPFLCGFLRPKIYVPTGISDNELSYILAHEQAHVKRLDHLVKPFAFLALIIHWFNPLMWVSFALMSRDMEMSCDESVLKKLGSVVKGSYSNSLLKLSVKRSGLILGSPLAFGESNVKPRIKNILAYKKPALWAIVPAVAVVALLIIALTANPKYVQAVPNIYSGYSVDTLMENKTPYVGNNSKVVALIDAMPLPEGIVRDSVELQTAAQPYGITVRYIMNDDSAVVSGGIMNSNFFYRNSVLLFSLIDNVDIVNCDLVDNTGKSAGATIVFTYTREDAEKSLGEDVRSFSAGPETLKKLIDRIR